MAAAELLRQLARLRATRSVDESAYQRAVAFIQRNPDRLCDRKNMQGHLSASGVVIQDGRIWFIRHPYLKTILLPAGHVDPGETPLQTANREFFEETGFTTRPVADELAGLCDVNIIQIPANPLKNEGAHFHVDLRYQLVMTDQMRGIPELPTFLIGRTEAPAEFHKYYH